VAAQLGVLAEEKRQSLILEPLGAPRSFADRLVLRQSLVNLVDNAIKHSPDGGAIRIRVSNANAGACIDVCDSGSGIPVDVQPRIFDRFFRATNEDAAGAGLGLAIAKWAVEANGGQLSLVKADDSGSTFRITLPSTAAS
jgi:signal transduction histidine kinase